MDKNDVVLENAGDHENPRINNADGTSNIGGGVEGVIMALGGEDIGEVDKFMEDMRIEEGRLEDDSILELDSTQPLNFDSTQSYYTLNVSIYYINIFSLSIIYN